MPTCSQAKIITNLETDLHKRIFKLSSPNQPDFQPGQPQQQLTQQQQQQQNVFQSQTSPNEQKRYSDNDSSSSGSSDINDYVSNTNQYNLAPPIKLNTASINYSQPTKKRTVDSYKLLPLNCKSAKLDTVVGLSNANSSTNDIRFYSNQRRNSLTNSDGASMPHGFLLPLRQHQNILQQQQQFLQSQKNSIQSSGEGGNSALLKQIKQQQMKLAKAKMRNSRSIATAYRRLTMNYSPLSIQESNILNINKIPINNLFAGDLGSNPGKREGAPVNFLYSHSGRGNRAGAKNITSDDLRQYRIKSMAMNNMTDADVNRNGNLHIPCSDNEEFEEEQSSGNCSANDENTSEKSTLSLPNDHQKSLLIKQNAQLKNQQRKSIDYGQLKRITASMGGKSSVKSTDLNNFADELMSVEQGLKYLGMNGEKTSARKPAGSSSNNLNNYFTTFPRLALEVESYDKQDVNNSMQNQEASANSVQQPENEEQQQEQMRRMSVYQAKRLLALASIRPSKTFHKSMTAEEIEVLKKYYELMKPKISVSQSNQSSDKDKADDENYTPILYDSAKVNFSSLKRTHAFIEKYKSEIENGSYVIEYCSTGTNGFVLKSTTDESIVKFPAELNDTFFALALTSQAKENPKLSEASLFRAVNWNDTCLDSMANRAAKLTSLRKENNRRSSIDAGDKQQSSVEFVPNSSGAPVGGKRSSNPLNLYSLSNTSSSSSSGVSSSYSSAVPSTSSTPTKFTFDYIKNLSSLVTSILQPTLLKQLGRSGVDLSSLPGGINFDLPSFEELGLDLNSGGGGQGADSNAHLSGGGYGHGAGEQYPGQSGKLKNVAYKKLKDRVSSTKVMWFAGPPERKPLSVVFEYAGVDLDHEAIIAETNNYLSGMGGHVVELEFVPRSVHFGSVYIENLWILTVNDMNTKFHIITNGIQIKDQKISAKSYDEFIFHEYERFIRNEKYKQLIKHHEKALAHQSNTLTNMMPKSSKSSKKSST